MVLSGNNFFFLDSVIVVVVVFFVYLVCLVFNINANDVVISRALCVVVHDVTVVVFVDYSFCFQFSESTGVVVVMVLSGNNFFFIDSAAVVVVVVIFVFALVVVGIDRVCLVCVYDCIFVCR